MGRSSMFGSKCRNEFVVRTDVYFLGIILKPFYICLASQKDIYMCLCKIHLHSRRGIGTIVKLVRTKIFHLNLMIMKASSSTFHMYHVHIVIMKMCIFHGVVLQLKK